MLFLIQPKRLLSLLCGTGTLLAHAHLGVHQEHQGLSCKAAFQLVTGAGGYSSSAAGLCVFLCWTSQGFCQTISPACWSPCLELPVIYALIDLLHIASSDFTDILSSSNSIHHGTHSEGFLMLILPVLNSCLLFKVPKSLCTVKTFCTLAIGHQTVHHLFKILNKTIKPYK